MANIQLIQTIYNICYSTTLLACELRGTYLREIAYRKWLWRFQGEYCLHGITGSLIYRPNGCAKLMSPSKGETVVHG